MGFLPIVDDLVNMYNTQQTNKSNQDIANQANAVNVQEAETNRNFQEHMSDTAHQRETADLKAAGLNPMLSGTGGSGASQPSGSAATATTGAPMQAWKMDQSNSILTSAMEAMKTGQDIKESDARIGLAKAQTAKTGTDEEVAKKGIPGSDLVNDAYSIAKPYIQKIKDTFRSGADPKNQPPKFDPWVEKKKKEQDQRNTFLNNTNLP